MELRRRPGGEILGPQALDLTLLAAFIVLALVSFFRKSVRLKYVALVAAVALPGVLQEQPGLDQRRVRLTDLSLPIVHVQPGVVPLHGVRGRVDGVMGPALLRANLRLRRADAVDGRRAADEGSALDVPPAIERRANWIKYALLAALVVYFVVTREMSVYRLRRAVLDVRPVRDDAHVDRPRRCCSSRPSSSATCTAGSSAPSARRSASSRT